jgi:hypothetical protein
MPPIAEIGFFDGRGWRRFALRSSFVIAYAAAFATTVWATWLELDRLSRRGPPVEMQATRPQPIVPDGEWRAWARHQTDFKDRVVALVTARQAPPADPSPAPSARITAEVARLLPSPLLKPAEWVDGRSQPLALDDGSEGDVLPSPPAPRGTFWSQILALLERASASPELADRGVRNQRIIAALYPSGGQPAGAQRDRPGGASARQAGTEGVSADARSRSGGQDTDSGRRSASDRSMGGGKSSDNDRSQGDDQNARGDRGGDRGDRGGRGDDGDRGGHGDRGDHGDRGGHGDRGDRGDHGDRGDRGDHGDRGDRGGRGRGH